MNAFDRRDLLAQFTLEEREYLRSAIHSALKAPPYSVTSVLRDSYDATEQYCR